MPNMFDPTEREAALDAMAATMGITPPAGMIEVLADQLNTWIPAEATAETFVATLGEFIALLAIGARATSADLDALAERVRVIEEDEATLG